MTPHVTVAVAPGTGLVVRRGRIVGVLPTMEDLGDVLVDGWLDAIDRATVGGEPVPECERALAPLGVDGHAAAIVVVGDRTVVALVGDIAVRAAGPGTELLLSGTSAPTTHHLDASVEVIDIGPAQHAAAARWLDLGAGVVHGAGVSVGLRPGGAVTEESIDPIDVDGPVLAGDEVVVAGLRCRNGHFNHPEAPNCVWCGLAMVQDSFVLVDGPRPPLGVLVVNETATYTLDTDHVIGRNPSRDPRVQEDRARGVPLQDPDRTVSRVHAAIVLDGWTVSVVDLGSANGTTVLDPDATTWESVGTGPRPLRSGSRLRIGPHVLTYHSHHVR